MWHLRSPRHFPRSSCTVLRAGSRLFRSPNPQEKRPFDQVNPEHTSFAISSLCAMSASVKDLRAMISPALTSLRLLGVLSRPVELIEGGLDC
ncbi:hypothetical protein M501DRAFT_1001266 [Patellaria atrata CBS 101060]|uniref:Uncharacterized protein n=1 Tax=Patellaria atrata CBS 101060 TaxID=1346257 RepID=A0A9P4VM77_9PEZI|nr:hypothetical protein M501DRAFT_1001266 [Patellaria atrata CBS 101060]